MVKSKRRWAARTVGYRAVSAPAKKPTNKRRSIPWIQNLLTSYFNNNA
jgi:hypothetical protein